MRDDLLKIARRGQIKRLESAQISQYLTIIDALAPRCRRNYGLENGLSRHKIWRWRGDS